VLERRVEVDVVGHGEGQLPLTLVEGNLADRVAQWLEHRRSRSVVDDTISLDGADPSSWLRATKSLG
jgi:hypothetical protein